MATNLNPGADGTLVSVAYQAAMANAPRDYSRTFEKAAESYGKTMEAQSKMWGNIGTLGAAIGGEMTANANELSDYAAKGSGLDSEGSQFLVDEIYANKEAQKDLGLFGGALGDRDTRQKRAELKLKQKELFAEIDLTAESINAGAQAVAAGLFDANLNETEADMVNAIIKSNLKDKVTENGNMAKLTRDEKTGELMYTMYKENGELAMINGESVTMTIKEFNKSIATNVDDKGAMQGTFSELNNNIATNGSTSTDGVYDPQMKQMHLNQLDNMLQTPTDLKRAMRTKFGYSNTSFFDDIQNPSTLSADLYSTLLTATGGGDELALGGITEGIEDADNSGGISQAELANATNYGILSANILGMKDPEVSKAYFKEYTTKKFEEAYTYGYSKKPPTPGGDGDADSGSGGGGGGGGLDHTNAYAVYNSSGKVNYKKADKDYAVRDTQISSEMMADIIWGIDSEFVGDYMEEFKLNSDGQLMWRFKEGAKDSEDYASYAGYHGHLASDKWKEHPLWQSDSKSKDGREEYNTIIEALKAEGIKDLPGYATPIIFTGTNREKIVQEHGKDVFNVGNTFKSLNITKEEFGRKQGAQSIAKKLNKKYGPLGFKFWTDNKTSDAIKMTYTRTGEHESIKTNRKTYYGGEHHTRDEYSFNDTIKWMDDRIKADKGHWNETITTYGDTPSNEFL